VRRVAPLVAVAALLAGCGSSGPSTITIGAALTYHLADFTGFFGNLVAFADAEWDFDAAVEGTRVRWTYTFHAQPQRGWVVRMMVVLFWARYMRRVLPGLIDEVRRVSAH
jgi:hypothetical protein